MDLSGVGLEVVCGPMRSLGLLYHLLLFREKRGTLRTDTTVVAHSHR